MSKLFTIAGTSVLNGKLTYRFATGKVSVREYKLKKTGHSDIALQELPEPMTKADAIAFLQSNGIDAVMPKTRVKKTAEGESPAETAEPVSFGARMAALRKQKAAEKAAALQAAADAEFFASQIAAAAATSDDAAAPDEAAA